MPKVFSKKTWVTFCFSMSTGSKNRQIARAILSRIHIILFYKGFLWRSLLAPKGLGLTFCTIIPIVWE